MQSTLGTMYNFKCGVGNETKEIEKFEKSINSRTDKHSHAHLFLRNFLIKTKFRRSVPQTEEHGRAYLGTAVPINPEISQNFQNCFSKP